jgi:LysM repeat protein
VITATPFGTPGMCSEHLIQVGETLYRIALQYGVSADEIAVANNILNPDLIEAGSTLLIPCVVPATPTPAQVPVVQGAETGSGQGGQGTTATSRQIYTVQAGDNIYQISLRFGVDMAELVAINGLNAVTMNMIYVGQEMIIPGTAVVIVTPTPVGATPAPVPAQPTATPYIIIITNTPIPGTTG